MLHRKYFYQLFYRYTDANGENHTFDIGYFSSPEKANNAINALREKIGFNNHSGTFFKNKFAVCFSNPIEEKSGLILYQSFHEFLDDEGYDNTTILGAFATYDEALAEQRKNSDKHPYNKHPEGFEIFEVEVDHIDWQEGFTSWDE